MTMYEQNVMGGLVQLAYKKVNLEVMLRNEHTSMHIKLNNLENLKCYCQERNLNYDEVFKNFKSAKHWKPKKDEEKK